MCSFPKHPEARNQAALRLTATTISCKPHAYPLHTPYSSPVTYIRSISSSSIQEGRSIIALNISVALYCFLMDHFLNDWRHISGLLNLSLKRMDGFAVPYSSSQITSNTVTI
jgi:hypothetical protein